MDKPVIAIAPMMDLTDRHYRYLMRIISRETLLYTEMVTTGALLNNEPKRFLAYHPTEHPIALQLGGSDPEALAKCAVIGQNFAYDEINLNVGCPSNRVQSGRFGACLMAEPDLVADCVKAMQQEVDIPVTVKCRIGIDDQEDYPSLKHFIETVAAVGCDNFTIHARKAWLKGLSPKQNREIPPLKYDVVYRIKQDFPELSIIINGGIKTIAEMQQHLQHVDGVMLGREAYYNPMLFTTVDKTFFGCQQPLKARRDILQAYIPYMALEHAKGTPVSYLSRHLLGLFQGMPGAKQWRRLLSEGVRNHQQPLELIQQAAMSIAS